MDRLELRFFGTFQPLLNDTPLHITSHKTRAILAWLAFHPKQPQQREMLATLLWPEHPKPMPTLRQTLSRLRRQIPDHLDVTRKTVALVGEWGCDIGRFQQALMLEDWEAVVELYQGEFLAGISADSLEFEEWLLLKREWFQREYLRVLRELTHRHFANNDYAKAYQSAWRRGETDRFDEAAQRDIMRALALLGRRNDALTHFGTVRDLLAEELDVDPAASTVLLRDQIANDTLPNREIGPTHKRRHNLPRQNTPFVGRADLLATLAAQITDPHCNLLTLQGMGGMGKTRLAIALGGRVVDRLRDGVWFVPLATVEQDSDDAEIVQAIAASLQITFPDGVRETSERLRFLIGRLQAKKLLLILDNYEQIVAQTQPILTLLNGVRNLKIVVTSREALGLQAEWLVDVVGLSESEAHELFMAAARRVSADFQPDPAINDIILRVAGMPLALELAAGWVRQFSCAEIAAQIADDISFLAANRADLPERQRSMQAVFNYSWRLLNEGQRDLLRRLAVFPNHFSTDAVREICAANVRLLAELTTHSLVQQVEGGRFGFHPAVRQFSAEQRTPEHDQIEQRCKRYYLTRLSEFERRDYDALAAFMGVEWDNVLNAWRLAAQSADDELLQAAQQPLFTYIRRTGERVMGEKLLHDTLQWLDGNGNDETTAILMCELANFSFGLNLYEQGFSTAQVAYTLASKHNLTRICGKASYLQGELYRRTGQLDQSLKHFQRAFDYVTGKDVLDVEAEALLGMSNVYRYQGRLDDAIAAAQHSVVVGKLLGEAPIARITHASLALSYEAARQYEQALRHHERALAISYSLGNQHVIALSLNNLAGVLASYGRYEESELQAIAGLEAIESVFNEHVEALLYFQLAIAQSAQFRLDAANASYAAALAVFTETGNRPRVAETRRRQGIVALRQGAWHVARRLSQDAAEQFAAIGQILIEESESRAAAAIAAWRLGDLEAARRELTHVFDLSQENGVQGMAWDAFGRIHLTENNFVAAEAAFEKATRLRHEAGAVNLSAESRAAWMTALHAQNKDVREHHAFLVNHLNTQNLYGTLDPIGIYLACLEVEFSAELQQSALTFLNAIAATIEDPFDRHDYLHHIPSHVLLLK